MPSQPQGQWEVLKDENNIPIDSLVTAVHVNLIPIITSPTVRPKAKVLYWHGRYITNYDDGGKIVSCLYDPETKGIEQYTVPIWPNISAPYDPSKIFCSAHLTLANGKLLTSGGERNIPPALSRGTKYSFIFDSLEITSSGGYPWRNTKTGIMQDPTLMDRGRWYPQLTKLHNGKVVAMSGYKYEDQVVELRPEMFDPLSETWTLFDVSAELAVPLYNGAHLIPFGDWKGEIFYDLVSFGTNLYPNPWTSAHRFKPDILNPEWNPVGLISPPAPVNLRYRGNSVVFPIRSSDKNIVVLNLGGGNIGYEKTAEIIFLGDNLNPQWSAIENMSYNRHDAPSALFLAEGTLMVIGGGHDMETVLTPEYLDYSDPDPSNWKWYNLPDMEVPRKYHSVALLIPDGSVWVA